MIHESLDRKEQKKLESYIEYNKLARTKLELLDRLEQRNVEHIQLVRTRYCKTDRQTKQKQNLITD